MNTKPKTCALLLLSLLISSQAISQTLRDYRCKIERVANAEAPPNSKLAVQEKNYIGREFTVERRTGIMAGALKNAYVTKPDVIDFGSPGNSYKVINSLRLDQGAGRGSNVYMLVVQEYVQGTDKPFVFADNDEVFFGKCMHF